MYGRKLAIEEFFFEKILVSTSHLRFFWREARKSFGGT